MPGNIRFAVLAVMLLIAMVVRPHSAAAEPTLFYFPPEWLNKVDRAKAITDSLSKSTGLDLQAKVADNYPQIINGFQSKQPTVAYIGSFIQALLYARNLSKPLARGVNGQEFYSSILIAPESAGTDVAVIIQQAGAAVAYTTGASSGETGAKSGTHGLAAVATNNHQASVMAIKEGKAKIAFVKNHWWKANAAQFPGMKQFEVPGVSDQKHPDYMISANLALPDADAEKIKEALKLAGPQLFDMHGFVDFHYQVLQPTLRLMGQGKIDPKTYTWK